MSVADKAILAIRTRITSGDYRPGDRLPPEHELADQLNISRNALREAVRALCEARVLEIRRGNGTFVSNLEPGTLFGSLAGAIDLMSGGTMAELFELRRLIEPRATGMAALRIREDQLRDLRAALEAMSAAPNVEGFIAIDVTFHSIIMQATENRALATLIEALGTCSSKARIQRGRELGGVHGYTLEQHRRILQALESHDQELATAASTIHLAEAERWARRTASTNQSD
ncbi:hypothetical protein ASG88_20975 [Nocardioides sp. Soil777]|uniref:FadR/GntR family transcriptional regulator n=1 Tax=Nocardioides sp. Soil777 TaxID=1736409 RepID=UPI0007032FD0|nr:FadR/GntR family transcriptional regulator [Nocardioides sp. Soil777]KRF05434.1 hypothetical protein ASG88_20975 [Nocardioides sp. Soil777]